MIYLIGYSNINNIYMHVRYKHIGSPFGLNGTSMHFKKILDGYIIANQTCILLSLAKFYTNYNNQTERLTAVSKSVLLSPDII